MNSPPEIQPFFGISGPPGDHPERASVTPSAVIWYKVYAGLMAVVYLAVAVLGIVILSMPAWSGSGSHTDPGAIIGGGIYTGMGVILGVPFAVSLFLRPKGWVWIFDLVLICIGLLSCACWPICIPLLIAWLAPEVKQHFGA